MVLSPKVFERLTGIFVLSTGLALSGCATTHISPETCMEETGYRGSFLSYSSGTTFHESCSIGKAAAAMVNIRNPNGSLKPIAPILDEQFKKNLPPEALPHYAFFLKQHGITQEMLKELGNTTKGPSSGAEHGLICKNAGSRTACDFAK